MVDSGREIEMEFGEPDNFQSAADRDSVPSNLYVHTEHRAKAYKRTGGLPKNAQFVT